MRAMMIGLLMCLSACGDSTGPEKGRALDLGRYRYESMIGTGILTITYTSADSVAGSWDLPQMSGPIALGFWNVDAFVLYGTQVTRVATTAGGRDSVTFRTTFSHRVTRTSCTVKAVPSSDPMRSCTLSYLGR